jgi:phenylacetate-coenzyme A ligase PaaK-like adenylate-forming protein
MTTDVPRWHEMNLYQPIVKYFFAPLYAWKDNSKYLTYLREFEHTQYLSYAEIADHQLRAVQWIIKYAYDHCPYYGEKYRSAGVDPSALSSLADLEKIPVLDKAEIQAHGARMIATNISKNQIIENFTGGSTGNPLKLYLDQDRRDSRTAGNIRHDQWAGREIGDKVACIWGATADFRGWHHWKARVRNRLLERMLYLDASIINHKTMVNFVEHLRRFRPKVLLGYANALALFARYVKENNLSGTIGPQSIISSAEVLTVDDRKQIETVFQCRVFDNYGCREASTLASECERHEGLHINAENVYLEFVRNQNAAEPGEMGEVLLTDLRNRVMPLIRYRIGDTGIRSGNLCTCGRGLPLMTLAAGRVTDFIVTADHNLVSGVVLSTYLITKTRGLLQVRFCQDTIGKVIVQIVPNENFHETDLRDLRELISQFLGPNTVTEFEFVDGIPNERSGKFRFTVSSIDPLEHVL